MAMTSAERSREYRARQRAAAAAAESAARDERDAAAPTTMRDAVVSAIASMKWLKDTDSASVAQAQMLAEIVDETRHAGDDRTMLSAHGKLSRVLHDLGGTPTVRMQRELRSRQSVPIPADDLPTAAAIDSAPNVTRFKRPAKRTR